MSDEEDENQLERRHFNDIVNSFRGYKQHSLQAINHTRQNWLKVKPQYHEQLPNRLEEFRLREEAIQINFEFIKQIVQMANCTFRADNGDNAAGLRAETVDPDETGTVIYSSPMNVEKVQSTLRQFVRDWSAEGAPERAQSYGPLLEALEHNFPKEMDRSKVRVLVPGCGLARLPYEIGLRGFSVQGNEVSYHMLLASSLILNRSTLLGFELRPFVHQQTNVRALADQLQAVRFPDIPLQGFGEEQEFSMAAGDFVEVYGEEEGAWDAVVTSFFLDTAKNPMEYIEAIGTMLKPGGVWINLGPLLYHYADNRDEITVELTMEEILGLLPVYSLKLEAQEWRTCHYTSNAKSLMRLVYECCFFVARKVTPQ